MRVLLTTGVYPPRIGGPARQVYDLAVALGHAGIEVAVLTFDNTSRIEIQGRVRVYYVKDKFRVFKLWRRYLGIKQALKKIKQEVGPDLVQANGARFLSAVVGSFAKKERLPAIVKYAGDFVYEKINQRFLMVPDVENVFKFNFKAKVLTVLEKRILKKFDLIWAQSEYQKNILEKYLKIDPQKIVVMPNYINVERELVEKSAGRKIILSASRFVPWKNVEAQIFVAKRLKEITQVPFFLYLVGGGDEAIANRVRKLIKEKGLVNEVKILQQVSPLEVHKNFKQAHIYLSTSLYEPFGIVFVEAMSAGLPIVALGVCSVPEVVKDGHVGFVVKRGPNYIERLAERLKIILENEDVYTYFSGNSLAEAEKYDLKTNINKFTNLYSRMISNAQHLKT